MRQRSLFDAHEPLFPADRVEELAGFVPLSELAEGTPETRRPGIAGIAAEAARIDLRNKVEYHELPCRSLLSPCESRRVPFDFTLNPYRGCEVACVYCFARYTHEYMELEQWLDFERKVFVKRGAREALVRDLRRLDLRGKSIAIGTATDPYQPAERRYRLTRSLLEVFAGRHDLRLSLTTKSDLVARDVDLLRVIATRNRLHVNVTVTTPHHTLARRIEPRAPRPDRRLAAVRALAEAGIPVGVFLMPLLPHINDGTADLDLLIRLAKAAGARYLATQVLFLRDCSRKRFFPFIQEQFPELLPIYHRLYSRAGAWELSAYAEAKTSEIQRLTAKHGLAGSCAEADEAGWMPSQLALGL